MLCESPLEIILGTIFLYRLLGWSAFAGYVVIFASFPINSFITKRAVKIQKGASVARDKRMQLVNELIGAVRVFRASHSSHETDLYKDQVRQVLCVGRKMDRASHGRSE